MKKLLMLVMSLFIIAAPMSAASVEQTTPTKKEMKQYRKNAEKDAKKRVKQLKKQGWEIAGSVQPETKFTNHLLKLEDYGGQGVELSGSANNMNSVSLGTAQARADAMRKYAEDQSIAIKGKIVDKMTAIGEEQMENFMNGFKAVYVTEIKGDLMPSIEMHKKDKKSGKYDVEVIFIIDQARAHAAQIRALERAAEKEKISLDIARGISEWIDE